MKKRLLIVMAILMLVFCSVGFAQPAEDNTVTPAVTPPNDPIVNITPEDISGGLVDGLDLIMPPIVTDILPNFSPPPAPGEDTPFIRDNGFGINFGPYLPNFNEITTRSTYMSRYIWYGQERFGGDAAWSLGTTYGIPDVATGTAFEGAKFYFDATTIQPASSDHLNQEENQFTLFAVKTINEGEKYETQLTTKNIYYNFSEQTDADGQEAGLQLALTNLLNGPNHKLIPSYYFGRVWDRDPQKHIAESDKGNISVVGLDYYLNIDENAETDLHVFGNITYLDAVASADTQVSYVTVGIDADLDMGNGVILTPFIQHIRYSDRSVTEEEAINLAGVSMNFHF